MRESRGSRSEEERNVQLPGSVGRSGCNLGEEGEESLSLGIFREQD